MDMRQKAITNNYINNNKNDQEYVRLISSQRELIKKLMSESDGINKALLKIRIF